MNAVVHFPDDFLQNIDMWRVKGFANLVVTHNGARYRLSFVDLGNVKQGLTGQGNEAGHFAERGMVVVQEISEDIIRRAVDKLAKMGYFESLIPVGSD
ncbi:hypothetical protein [Sphingomonas sp.]|jgi:hypothetical protein|uniref:hypothetical protein n=1 Tax=Sphingomonas sp. TaxID=28214 RepID=UPI0035A908A0